MLALHHLTPPGKWFWTHAALVTPLLFLGPPWAIAAPLFMRMPAIMLRRRHSASAKAEGS